VLEIAKPGDTLWIHDYQLLLLPLLRERLPDARIGFFLHIPFPSFEVFRLLPGPWRRELLEGMLGADHIGFHTHDYTQYFLRSVFRTLGHDHHLGQIQVAEQIRRADTYPIGIDFTKFEAQAQSEATLARVRQVRQVLGNRAILFSVDRLDYTKGILQRLRGYEEFLERNPDWRGKVVFVLSVVPSREEVPSYHAMKRELDELVGGINGRFGKTDWVPILFHYRNLLFPELVAHYRSADVALITPLRDGMNLVAKEYLACQTEGKGVLILSEMAGAARELGEAVLVNPNHRGEVAEAILEALWPQEEQVRRNRPMREGCAPDAPLGRELHRGNGSGPTQRGPAASNYPGMSATGVGGLPPRTAPPCSWITTAPWSRLPHAEFGAPDPELRACWGIVGAGCALYSSAGGTARPWRAGSVACRWA
jgi:trehalose 6-phosphate synthase/phosphatase